MTAQLIDNFITGASAQANRVVGPMAQAGIGTPILPFSVGLVVLETTGRRTGRTRQVPLLANRRGQTVQVMTVRPDSQWVKNLEAEPRAAVWYAGRPHPVVATVTRRGGLAKVTLEPDS